MPSCLVRLTLLSVSVALTAAQFVAPVTRDVRVRTITMKDVVYAHQHGGRAGMRAIDDLYCDGTSSKEKGENAQEYQDKNNDGHCDNVNLCIENNYGDALAEDDIPEEAIRPGEVHLLTQLSCIGNKKETACRKVDFLCKTPGRCLLNCTRPSDSKRKQEVCEDVDVCKGTHIVCIDEKGVDQWKNGKKGNGRGGNVCDVSEKECPDFYDNKCGDGGKKNSVFFNNPNPKDGV